MAFVRRDRQYDNLEKLQLTRQVILCYPIHKARNKNFIIKSVNCLAELVQENKQNNVTI